MEFDQWCSSTYWEKLSSTCLHVCVRVWLPQAQLETSEQEMQDMIKLRIRKMEEIRSSVNELEVDQTHRSLKV